MSPRERWIVYPLLFFALGIAFRQHVFLKDTPPPVQQLRAKEVVCENLIITDRDGERAVHMGSKPRGSGFVYVYGWEPNDSSGKLPVIVLQADDANRTGSFKTRTAEGTNLVEVGSHEGIGQLVLYDAATGRSLRFAPTSLETTPSVDGGEVPPLDTGHPAHGVLPPADPRRAIPRPPVPEMSSSDPPDQEPTP